MARRPKNFSESNLLGESSAKGSSSDLRLNAHFTLYQGLREEARAESREARHRRPQQRARLPYNEIYSELKRRRPRRLQRHRAPRMYFENLRQLGSTAANESTAKKLIEPQLQQPTTRGWPTRERSS
jgi:hypothetical protein